MEIDLFGAKFNTGKKKYSNGIRKVKCVDYFIPTAKLIYKLQLEGNIVHVDYDKKNEQIVIRTEVEK